MQKIFVESHNLISPLGNTSAENFTHLQNDNSGVQFHNRADIDDAGFWASIITEKQIKSIETNITNVENYTRFEKLLIASINDCLKKSAVDITSPKTIFIFSTTKKWQNLRSI